MGLFSDLKGTSVGSFLLAIGGVLLKNSGGNLLVRNSGDSADAQITASQVNVSGDAIVLNSDAANTGSDHSITLTRPATGMTASYSLIFPNSPGSPGQVLQTDGAGVTSWGSIAGTNDKLTKDTTSLAFGSAATVSMFTLPANAVPSVVRVIIDTPFNGTPSMSVGIDGNASKYMASTQVNLSGIAGDRYEAYPGAAPVGTSEAWQISYTAGGASAGAARIEVEYAVPS